MQDSVKSTGMCVGDKHVFSTSGGGLTDGGNTSEEQCKELRGPSTAALYLNFYFHVSNDAK